MNRLQNEAVALLSIQHKGASIACTPAGRSLVCEVDGEKWLLDEDCRRIRRPDGTTTDLAELDYQVLHTPSPSPYYDPPDDEYEAEFTGRSPYRGEDDHWGSGEWDYGSGKDVAARARWERDLAL